MVRDALFVRVALGVAAVVASALSTRAVLVVVGGILGVHAGLVVADVGAATATHRRAIGVLEAFRGAGIVLTGGWTDHGGGCRAKTLFSWDGIFL